MHESQLYIISTIALLTTIGLAMLGEHYNSVSILFNVMLMLIGVLSGILTSLFFSKQQERKNLGKYTSSAYRLSLNVYDSLTEVTESINKAIKDESSDKKMLLIRLEETGNKLRMIRKSALAANENWREFLPQHELQELEEKERKKTVMFPLSNDNTLAMTEETISLE